MKTLAALTIVGLVAGTAAADEACPKTSQWGKTPNFWDPDPTTSAPRKQLWVRYDGHWAGAAQVPLDNGSSTSRVRFLDGGAADPALYVSIEIDTTGIDREVFWFGFAPASATDSNGATLIEVSVRADATQPNQQFQVLDQQSIRCGADSCPSGATCTQTACGAVPAVSYRVLHGVTPPAPGNLSSFKWDGTAFDNTVLAKSWMTPATGPAPRAWRGSFYTPDTSPTGGTVMLRIPNATIGGGGDQKVWIAGATCNFLGSGPVNCMQQGDWPSAGQVVETATDVYSAPKMADWGALKRTSACAAQPELMASGVQNGATYDANAPFTYPQHINFDNDGNLSNDPPNWFAARVAMPLASSAGKYQARFFLADWGSQIGNLDVAQWFEIGSAPNPGATQGSTENLVLRFPPTSMTAAQQKTLACKYSNCTSATPGCPYPTGAVPDLCAGEPGARTHAPHQCTQVRLENTTATGSYQFARDSMIFNTDVVGASVFWRVATISTKGMNTVRPAPAPAPPEGRDIYIYVRAANLPKTSDEIPAEATVKRLEDIALHTPKPPQGQRDLKDIAYARQIRESLGNADVEHQKNALLEIRKLSLDTARVVAPTLEFRVFYDTGKVMDTHTGKPFHWLAPMTSFGYVVEHVGKIKGWNWALDGAEPLGDNWYRIRMRDGGDQQLRTRVQAVEDVRMPPGIPEWPPGKAWLNQPGHKGSIKVALKKGGGCSVGGDASPVTTLLLGVALWYNQRRKRVGVAWSRGNS